jgi:hypothetical protein
MYRGYVKQWRMALDAGWIRKHKLWAVWSWCLLKATHQEFDDIVGLQTVHLLPGQFVTGREKGSAQTGLTEQEYRTIMKFLKKTGNITIKSTNKFSIVSIVNWDIYQGNDNKINQHTNQPATNKEPATNHIQEHKNKEEHKDITSLPVGDKSPPCPHQEIIDLYHRILPELPPVKIWTSARQGLLRSRWNEDKERQTLSWWEQYFLKVKKSPFLTGNVNNFKATLEWTVKQSNMVKILEGNYEGGNNGRATFGSAGKSVKRTGGAASDGQPYPVDFEG